MYSPAHLWRANLPKHFWRCQPDPIETQWQAAISNAVPLLECATGVGNIEGLLQATLGEGQFGPNHWSLGRITRLYYLLKPILPRRFTQLLRQLHSRARKDTFPLGWPIEDRYVRFQWEIMRQLLDLTGANTLNFIHFWPDRRRFALVLTHDIETAAGQSFVREIVALEEHYGFRSSFNFVPERYPLDEDLMLELRERGFEVGVHGLKHDGKLFNSQQEFIRHATHINRYLKSFGAVGFRSPLMHRHPEWMQILEIEYDLSFFDTDPFEPIPGGTMSIWPFMIGHFVELPYTLVQDYTLTAVLGERTARLWLQKLEHIAQYYGMALLNTHPDYLKDAAVRSVYVEFLDAVSKRADYWHALPNEVAS